MVNKTIISIETVIDFIESHLDDKLDLETVANAVNYSKYHLHRMFTNTVGMTIHDYVGRRQLTEAAKMLVFSNKPIIEISFTYGYKSQQAFSLAFKSMYKIPPAEYRERKEFYPLQLQFTLKRNAINMKLSKSNIRFAEICDVPAWIELVRLAIDGYPCLVESDYIQTLNNTIKEKRALILEDKDILIGVMIFSYDTGSIEFMGIHPQYRNRKVQKIFLDKLMEDLIPNREISVTSYRIGDKADTGYRKELQSLGFAERELLIEFGYPTQRFVHPPNSKEVLENDN